MLKRILQLSTCLMMTLNLSSAQAEIRDSDFQNGKCQEGMSVQACLAHCKPQIENCSEKSKATPYGCCHACVWPSTAIRTLGDNQLYNDIQNKCLN